MCFGSRYVTFYSITNYGCHVLVSSKIDDTQVILRPSWKHKVQVMNQNIDKHCVLGDDGNHNDITLEIEAVSLE